MATTVPEGVTAIKYDVGEDLWVCWPSWDGSDAWDVFRRARQGGHHLTTLPTVRKALAYAREAKSEST